MPLTELAIAALIYDMPIKDYKEFTALVTNVYHEASGEGVAGMSAVAHVTLNRVKSSRYPDTIHKVVHQPVQFSWTLESHHKPIVVRNVIDQMALDDAIVVSAMVYNGLIVDPTKGALHHVNLDEADPDWAKGAVISYAHKNHTFFTGVK